MVSESQQRLLLTNCGASRASTSGTATGAHVTLPSQSGSQTSIDSCPLDTYVGHRLGVNVSDDSQASFTVEMWSHDCRASNEHLPVGVARDRAKVDVPT